MALIYIVGASGSGKDSLMRYGRMRLADDPNVLFAHRYITRAADAGGENHVALSPQEFDARAGAGLFALHWRSHGQSYGIGIEINQWLAKGITVVVNGSREYLDTARLHYPDLLPVWIEVTPEVLEGRLQMRARESETAIAERLQRHAMMQQKKVDGIIISNDGMLDEAGEAFVNVIRQQSNRILCA